MGERDWIASSPLKEYLETLHQILLLVIQRDVDSVYEIKELVGLEPEQSILIEGRFPTNTNTLQEVLNGQGGKQHHRAGNEIRQGGPSGRIASFCGVLLD